MARYFLQARPGVLVLLARHGSTTLNDPDSPKLRGWADVPLTRDGRLEAQLAGNKLRPYQPKSVTHSDLMRDSETGNIIAAMLNIPVECDFSLRTWDVGDYTQKPEEDVAEAVVTLYKNPDMTPPGSSESFNAFSRRFLSYLDKRMELASSVEAMRPPVLVTHGRNIALAHSYIDSIQPWKASMPKAGGFAVIRVAQDRTLQIELVGNIEPAIADV